MNDKCTWLEYKQKRLEKEVGGGNHEESPDDRELLRVLGQE